MFKKSLLGILAPVVILVVVGVGVGVGWWLPSPTSDAEQACMEAWPHFHDGAFANPHQKLWELRRQGDASELLLVGLTNKKAAPLRTAFLLHFSWCDLVRELFDLT